MRIAIDFDGTIVKQDGKRFDDTSESSLEFLPGAREGLLALKRAGHVLLLWSSRSSLALRQSPTYDPLVRAGVVKRDLNQWRREQPIHEARYRQMRDFVERELPDVFDAVDDGHGGSKPIVDLFIDDKAVRLGSGVGGTSWRSIAMRYGEPVRGK